jgi:hypothetical protein
MNLINSKILISLRHPLSLIGYVLFLCAYLLLENDFEYTYLFFIIGAITIIGGFTLEYRQTPTSKVEIINNTNTKILNNEIKVATKMNNNKKSTIEKNQIG